MVVIITAHKKEQRSKMGRWVPLCSRGASHQW